MTKGFYEIAKNSEDGYDFLESLNLDGLSVDAYQYLHGHCDVFARRLSDEYGYKIVFAIDYDDLGVYLVHAFTKQKCNGETYYIDVRGITDNIEEVFAEFDWSEDLCCIEFQNTREASKYLKKRLKFRMREGNYQDADNLIKNFSHYYKIS